METMRLGRNDLCRCGSGKKFKKCCLPRQSGAAPVPAPHLSPKLASDGIPEYVVVKGKGRTHRSQLRPGDECQLQDGGWAIYRPDLMDGGSVLVKGKGWTPERDLQPGDQYEYNGVWVTFQPERVIGTTEEHPFYVHGKGWTPLREISPGDIIRTEDGWVPVGSITNTGRYETVYNLRVQDYHTYFVGAQDWGFGVWAHNAYQPGKQDVEISKLIPPSSRPFADPAKLARHGPFDWKKYTPIIVETDGTSLWLMDGMTRVENARRAGITHLPANVYRR